MEDMPQQEPLNCAGCQRTLYSLVRYCPFCGVNQAQKRAEAPLVLTSPASAQAPPSSGLALLPSPVPPQLPPRPTFVSQPAAASCRKPVWRQRLAALPKATAGTLQVGRQPRWGTPRIQGDSVRKKTEDV